MVAEALSVIHCLPDYKIPSSPLYVIYPDKKFKPLRVQRFIELFKKHLDRYQDSVCKK